MARLIVKFACPQGPTPAEKFHGYSVIVPAFSCSKTARTGWIQLSEYLRKQGHHSRHGPNSG